LGRFFGHHGDWQGFTRELDELYAKIGDTMQLPLRGGVARLPAGQSGPDSGTFPMNVSQICDGEAMEPVELEIELEQTAK
jgi:hypothetical protein